MNRVSIGAELLFYKLLSLVDDFGRYDARPGIVRGNGYPLRESVTLRQVSEWLVELDKAGAIRVYHVNGKPYLELHEFADRQRLRAQKSKYPDPPPEEPLQKTLELVPILHCGGSADAPPPHADADADAETDADADASRRVAALRSADPAGEPEGTIAEPVSQHESLSRSGCDGSIASEPVRTGPSREREAQTVKARPAAELVSAALESMRERFADTDRDLASRVAAVAVKACADVTADQLRELIRLAGRPYMRAPTLYLTTVPEEISRRLIPDGET